MLTKKLFSRIAVLLLLLLIVLGTVHCAIQFQYDSEQCLGELVEYQCTVTGSPNTLTWRIRDENGTLFGSVIYDDSVIGTPVTIGGVFSVEQLSTTPSIVSTVSFTVQSSINGYTIICQEFNKNNEILTILITGPPLPPENVTIGTLTNDFIINWTPPSYASQCINSYIAKITDCGNGESNGTITNSTTDTSVTIPIAGLSPGIYCACVSVASVDTANRTGNCSEKKCLTLHVPGAPNVTYADQCNFNDSFACVLLKWNFSESNQGVPKFKKIFVTQNDSDETDFEPSVFNETYKIRKGISHVFRVYGESIVARGPSGNLTIFVNENDTLPPCPTMTVSRSPSSSTITINTTVTRTNTTSTTSTSTATPTSSCLTVTDCCCYDDCLFTCCWLINCSPECPPNCSCPGCSCHWWICIIVIAILILAGLLAVYYPCKFIIAGILLKCRELRKRNLKTNPQGRVDLHVSESEKPPVPSKADTPDIYSKATEAETAMEYAEVGLKKKNKKSDKKNHPQKDSATEAADNVQYSVLKQEVQYVDLSHTKAPFRRPPPKQTTVDYAAIAKH